MDSFIIISYLSVALIAEIHVIHYTTSTIQIFFSLIYIDIFCGHNE